MEDYGKPGSYLTLQPGTAVVSSDGERVGTVQHVLADEEKDIFDGLVVDCGDSVFVDASQVEEIFDNAVVLKLVAAEVERLPKPGPSPAVMEAQGSADSEGPLESKLRRAWDLISGNY